MGVVVVLQLSAWAAIGARTRSPTAPTRVCRTGSEPICEQGVTTLCLLYGFFCFGLVSFLFFFPGAFCTFHGRCKLGVKSMADEQEIMCKLESIKEIRYVCFVPHRLHEAAFSSGERRCCIDPKVAIVLLRERKLPLASRRELKIHFSKQGGSICCWQSPLECVAKGANGRAFAERSPE